MLNKKSILTVALLGAFSASAMAAVDDTARIDNLRWVGTLTTQAMSGSLIVTDINDDPVVGGKIFQLGQVDITDLTFAENNASPAVLVAQEYTDDNADGEYTAADDTLTGPVNADWTINSVEYSAIAGGVQTVLDNPLTVTVNNTEATATDGSATAATAADTISILLKGDAGTEEVPENVTSVEVSMSITAAQVI